LAEHQPSKHEALSSNSSINNNNKKSEVYGRIKTLMPTKALWFKRHNREGEKTAHRKGEN
jgi:hypothetical protein